MGYFEEQFGMHVQSKTKESQTAVLRRAHQCFDQPPTTGGNNECCQGFLRSADAEGLVS